MKGDVLDKQSTDPPTSGEVDLANIRDAADTIAGHVVRTPCQKSATLSEVVDIDLYLKFENLQFTASFKERGALN